MQLASGEPPAFTLYIHIYMIYTYIYTHIYIYREKCSSLVRGFPSHGADTWWQPYFAVLAHFCSALTRLQSGACHLSLVKMRIEAAFFLIYQQKMIGCPEKTGKTGWTTIQHFLFWSKKNVGILYWTVWLCQANLDKNMMNIDEALNLLSALYLEQGQRCYPNGIISSSLPRWHWKILSIDPGYHKPWVGRGFTHIWDHEGGWL